MRDWAARWGHHAGHRQREGEGRALPVGLPRGLREQARGLAIASILVLVLTLVLLAVRGTLSTANLALLYLTPVLAASTLGGLVPAAIVGAACVVTLDLLFVPPYGVFDVGNAQDGLTLLLFLGVAVLTSELAARARARAEEAGRRARATALLYDLSGALAAPDLVTILSELTTRLGRIFRLHSCAILLAEQDGSLRPRGYWGAPPVYAAPSEEADVAAAMTWALAHGSRINLSLHGSPDGQASPSGLIVPLRTSGRAVGLLRLIGSPALELTAEDGLLLGTFTTQAALAIERAQLAEEAAQAAVVRESNRVKAALLANVSHDLRTPLATIRGAGDALRQPSVAADVAVRDELLTSIVEEAERLSVLVGNLLDLSRIEAGALQPQRHLYDLAEICTRVAARFGPRLAGHSFTLDLPEEMPLAPVDYQQIDGVVANLLDNAAKYAPAGTAVRLRLRREQDAAVLTVADGGPGIAPADRERVFVSFYRVPGRQTSTTPGTGLGLPICRGIVEAHGGTIGVGEAPEGGACIEVRLPLVQPEGD